MPELNPNLAHVGSGFAAFLAPPGPEVVRFTVGQPDFDTPAPVVAEAKAALDRGETAYTRPQGTPSLCEAVKTHLARFEIDVLSDDVVVAPGCKQALLYGMMAVMAPGDEVLLLSPAWPSYDGMIRLAGATPVHVPVRRDNYHPDFDGLERHVQPTPRPSSSTLPTTQPAPSTLEKKSSKSLISPSSTTSGFLTT